MCEPFALSRLASLYREIIICYYRKKMSIVQIAQCLYLPEGSVKCRLYCHGMYDSETLQMLKDYQTSAAAL